MIHFTTKNYKYLPPKAITGHDEAFIDFLIDLNKTA